MRRLLSFLIRQGSNRGQYRAVGMPTAFCHPRNNSDRGGQRAVVQGVYTNSKVLCAAILLTALVPAGLHAKGSLTAWRSARSGLLGLDAVRTELDLYLHWDDENINGRVETARNELDRIDATTVGIRDCPALRGYPDARDALLDACRAFRRVVEILGDQEAVVSADNAPFAEALQAVAATARPATEAVQSLMPFIAAAGEDDGIEAPYNDPEARRLYAMLSDSKQQMTRAERLRRLRDLSADETAAFSRQAILLETAVTLFVASERVSNDDDHASRGRADSDKGLAILDDILGSAEYSSLMADAWLLWRAKLQHDHYGMSNWGVIPNAMFNAKRLATATTIEDHLAEHPDDTGAMRQLVALMSYPNIRRGGPLGHTGMDDMQTFLAPEWRTQRD